MFFLIFIKAVYAVGGGGGEESLRVTVSSQYTKNNIFTYIQLERIINIKIGAIILRIILSAQLFGQFFFNLQFRPHQTLISSRRRTGPKATGYSCRIIRVGMRVRNSERY